MAILAILVVVGIAFVMLGTGGVSLGGKLSASDIAGVASNAGFSGSDLPVAVAVALAESGGNADAVGDQALAPANGPSVGLWQINTAKHKDYTPDQLHDPQTNADAAYSVYRAAGDSFQPWSTYNSGAYGGFLNQASDAVSA